ncbi:MAG: alpha/beta fold hydrolase, partial [Acidobacteriota bacterium]
RFFSDDELRAVGFDEATINNPRFVKARGAMNDAEHFDAGFFRIPPSEARILDPQHRHFLECSYQALEDAGYASEAYRDRVGVYAGTSANTYLTRVLTGSPEAQAVGPFQLLISNHSDYLPTRVSYKLNLRGPSVNVQTACSTSLTAIHMACQGLLAGDCDLALAGGASVAYREAGGHIYMEGGIQTPDGHTRTFDADAAGVGTGSGVGVVALKRLADAQRDGDTVRAVVLGTASNNDGGARAGFTAPGVDGQAEVILAAQIQAGVDPETISYVEAHGTGTALGDPIEIAALTEAFRAGTERRGYCAIGSAKTNLGHLDAAAGVAGFVKTVKALEHQQLPPSLNFRRPNPKIDFASSPFYVSERLAAWPAGGTPRRAAVSAFGIGGTNAHAILEEAPPPEPTSAAREWQILPLSARSQPALDAATARLAEALETRDDLDLADVAYTLQVGRQPMDHRRTVVCRDRDDAIAALTGRRPRQVVSAVIHQVTPTLAFLLSGQGSQHPGMALGLYRDEPVFRQTFDRCAAALREVTDLDLHQLIRSGSSKALDQTRIAQPALFAVELALARLWQHWGIRPQAMLGHSLGEYVAACLAGVFSPEDGTRLVAKRGQLMQDQPAGAMLAVSLAAGDAIAIAAEAEVGLLSVATISGPKTCVLAGPSETVAAATDAFEARGVKSRRLHTSHAFHSPMMEAVVAPFVAEVEQVDLRPPRIPYVSNLTGSWIRAEEATDPAYWGEHLQHTVLLDDGFNQLFTSEHQLVLEVGPGRHLTSAARQHPAKSSLCSISQSLPVPGSKQDDGAALLMALGHLWTAGVEIDWRAFSSNERRRRVPLPTYPFERQRHWVDRLTTQTGSTSTAASVPEAAVDDAATSAQTTDEASEPTADAPAGASEQAIAAAFCEILGVERVGRHDDFFELGGSSLSALHLPALLRTSLGAELDATALLESPTVALLAEHVGELEQGQPQRPACLVRLSASGTGSPLFMVHPVGGTIYWFRDLARALDAGRPFYALQSPGLHDGEETLGSVEEMAAHYLEAVRQTQPHGPYWLGGSSMGGSIAFEMARQLRAADEDVALLVLLDSPCLDQLPPRPDEAQILASVFNGSCPLDVDTLRDLLASQNLDTVLQRISEAAAERAEAVAAGSNGNGASAPEPSPDGQPTTHRDEVRRLYRVSSANVNALYTYEPEPQPVSAMFLRAAHRREVDAQRPELPWVALAEDGIEIQPVPGDHVSMNYPPNVDEVARRLRRRLGRN